MYDATFGSGASKHPDHLKNFGCVKNITTSFELITTNTLDDLGQLLETRMPVVVREKRAVGLIITATLAIISLISSISSSIYFSLELDALKTYINDVSIQLSLNGKFSEDIATNTRIVNNNTQLIAVRTNLISNYLVKLKQINACTLRDTFLHSEVSKVSHDLRDFREDLIQGKLTSRLLTLSALRALMKDSLSFRGSFSSEDPLSIYPLSSVSLLRVDKKTKTVSFLLAFPAIEREPSFFRLNVLNPSSTVKTDKDVFHAFRVSLDESDLVLPAAVVKKANFDLTNLKKEDLLEIKNAYDCQTVNQRQVCRNFPLPDTTTLSCLSGLLFGDQKGLKTCHVSASLVTDNLSTHIDRGDSGMLISSAFTPKIYGISKGKKEMIATTHDESDKGVCVFIPSRFDEVQFISTYWQKPRYFYHHNLADHVTLETKVSWFVSESFSNLSNLSRDLTLSKLKKMVRETVAFHPLSFIGHRSVLTFVSLTLSIVACLVLLAWKLNIVTPPWEANESAFSRQRNSGQSVNLRDLTNNQRLKDEIKMWRENFLSLSTEMDALQERVFRLQRIVEPRATGLLSPDEMENRAKKADKESSESDGILR